MEKQSEVTKCQEARKKKHYLKKTCFWVLVIYIVYLLISKYFDLHIEDIYSRYPRYKEMINKYMKSKRRGKFIRINIRL